MVINMNEEKYTYKASDLNQNNKSRIQESTLVLLSALGGAAGGLAAMYLFRHKTKHAKFFLGLPALLVIHFIIAFLIIF